MKIVTAILAFCYLLLVKRYNMLFGIVVALGIWAILSAVTKLV